MRGAALLTLLVAVAACSENRRKTPLSASLMTVQKQGRYADGYFRTDVNGWFLHPGQEKPTLLSFKVPADTELVEVELFIHALSAECLATPTAGVVHFAVRVNGAPIADATVDRANGSHLFVPVSPNDAIELEAAHVGDLTCGWGGARFFGHASRRAAWFR